MSRSRTRDPLDSLTRSEKRSWRATERRLRTEHDTEQAAALLGLAASGGGVTGIMVPLDDDGPATRAATPVEMIIAGRRLRAWRVHRPSVARLRDALSNLASVPLTAVGRYGPYWVLTFRASHGPLVLLADHLTLLPDRGGPGGRERSPLGPLATLGV